MLILLQEGFRHTGTSFFQPTHVIPLCDLAPFILHFILHEDKRDPALRSHSFKRKVTDVGRGPAYSQRPDPVMLTSRPVRLRHWHQTSWMWQTLAFLTVHSFRIGKRGQQKKRPPASASCARQPCEVLDIERFAASRVMTRMDVMQTDGHAAGHVFCIATFRVFKERVRGPRCQREAS